MEIPIGVIFSFKHGQLYITHLLPGGPNARAGKMAGRDNPVPQPATTCINDML